MQGHEATAQREKKNRKISFKKLSDIKKKKNQVILKNQVIKKKPSFKKIK